MSTSGRKGRSTLRKSWCGGILVQAGEEASVLLHGSGYIAAQLVVASLVSLDLCSVYLSILPLSGESHAASAWIRVTWPSYGLLSLLSA